MNFDVGIRIGAVFDGMSAFGSTQKALSSLERRVTKLNSKKINLNAVGAVSELSRLNRKLKATENAITKINSRKLKINSIAAKRQDFRSSIMDKVALGATIVAPLKVAIDFESSMADVKKVVNFQSQEEVERFSGDITKLSRTIPLAASELAEITASGGQLGIAKGALLDFTKVTAKMSTAFDMLPSQAGESSAKLMNIFKLDVAGVSRLGDALNHLSDNTAAKAGDMVNVLARTGGMGKSLGLNETQIASLANAFLALGKPPEIASSAINSMFNKLGNAGAQGKKFKTALATMGTSVEELQDGFDKNGEQALLSFFGKLNTLEKYEKAEVLSALFGAEYADDVTLLAGSVDTYKKSISLLADEQKFANSMEKEFQARSATTSNNLRLLGNSVAEIGINIGSVLLPALNSVIAPLRNIGGAIASFLSEFPVLSKVVGGVVIGVVGLGLAMSVLGYVGGFVVSGLLTFANVLTLGKASLVGSAISANLFNGALIKTKALLIGSAIKTKLLSAAMWIFNGALSANPIGLVVVGMAALVGGAVLLYNTFEPFKTLVDSLWEKFKSFFGGVLSGFSSVGSALSSVAGFFGFGDAKVEVGLPEKLSAANAKVGVPTISRKRSAENTSLKQENKIDVVVNNPASTVEVESAIVRAMSKTAFAHASLGDIDI